LGNFHHKKLSSYKFDFHGQSIGILIIIFIIESKEKKRKENKQMVAL